MQIETECDRFQQKYQTQFRDTARIRLFFLRANQTRTIQKQFLQLKNIKRIYRTFATKNCRRLVAKNYISILISRENLEAAIYRSNTIQNTLFYNIDKKSSELQLLFELLVYFYDRYCI